MSRQESPSSQAETACTTQAARSWLFARLFAAVAFLPGACIIFSIGFDAVNPPPPGPGQAGCGLQVLAGMIAMIVGTPLAAITFALGGALVGGVFDILFPRPSPSVRRGASFLAKGIFTITYVAFLALVGYPFLRMAELVSASWLDAVTVMLLLVLILTTVIGIGVALLRESRK
jgi:hypothetical protein